MKAPAAIEKRRPLNRRDFAHLMLEQNGICGCGCGVKMSAAEGIIDEHRVPLALGGTNAIENRHLFREPCAKRKTKGDAGRIAKAKAQGGETGQRARRDRRGAGSIKSAGFGPRSRKFDGTVSPTIRALREDHG